MGRCANQRRSRCLALADEVRQSAGTRVAERDGRAGRDQLFEGLIGLLHTDGDDVNGSQLRLAMYMERVQAPDCKALQRGGDAGVPDSSRVYPSARPNITSLVPMPLPDPGTFLITIGPSMYCCIDSTSIRPIMSVPPPAANGMTSVTALPAADWAADAGASTSAANIAHTG